MKLLHIDSSPFTTQSTSRVLSAAIVAQLQENHRIQSVIYRDVGLTPPPHLTEAVFKDRKSTRLNSSHYQQSRMPSSA